MNQAIAFPRDFSNRWNGFRRIADPKVTLASVAGMTLGAALAAAAGPLDVVWLLLTVFGVFCIEFAKNAAGEIVDWDSGTDLAVEPADRSPFSGGKRVLVEGLLARREVVAIAVLFYVLALLVAASVVVWREPRALGLAAAGVLLAYFYHASPFKLAYRGFGEAAVALTYGPLLCAGTYLVQRQSLPFSVFMAAVPVGLLIGAFLWINEFPDFRADSAAKKRNLVVCLGRRRAARAFVFIVAAAYVTLSIQPLLGQPLSILLGWFGAVPAAAACGRLLESPDCTARIIPAQGWTLMAFMTTAIGMAVGVLIGS